MAELVELDGVDALGAGAIGIPGQRAFYIQAEKGNLRLTVLVEKEQVALLAAEAVGFLDGLTDQYPEELDAPALGGDGDVTEPAVPLFRARLIGLGFEPERRLVLLELRERGDDEGADEELGDEDVSDEDEEVDAEAVRSALAGLVGESLSDAGVADDGYVARIFATRAQVRAMATNGAAAVVSGRPRCPLCDQPMDPEGHICPRWN